jgi:hypothetical protein
MALKVPGYYLVEKCDWDPSRYRLPKGFRFEVREFEKEYLVASNKQYGSPYGILGIPVFAVYPTRGDTTPFFVDESVRQQLFQICSTL